MLHSNQRTSTPHLARHRCWVQDGFTRQRLSAAQQPKRQFYRQELHGHGRSHREATAD